MNQKRMRKRSRVSGLTCLVAATLLFSLPFSEDALAEAYPSANAKEAQSDFFSRPAGISRKEAARRARSETDGKVIAIKPVKQGDGFNVRLVVDGGRVVTVRVDKSGKVHR